MSMSYHPFPGQADIVNLHYSLLLYNMHTHEQLFIFILAQHGKSREF